MAYREAKKVAFEGLDTGLLDVAGDQHFITAAAAEFAGELKAFLGQPGDRLDLDGLLRQGAAPTGGMRLVGAGVMA